MRYARPVRTTAGQDLDQDLSQELDQGRVMIKRIPLADAGTEETLSRETLDRQFAQQLRDLRKEHPNGLPGELIKTLVEDYKLGSRATFYRRQAQILGEPDSTGVKKLRRGTFVITEEMHKHFPPQLSPRLEDVRLRLKKHFPDSNVPKYPHFTKVVKRHIDTDWYRKIRLGRRSLRHLAGAPARTTRPTRDHSSTPVAARPATPPGPHHHPRRRRRRRGI